MSDTRLCLDAEERKAWVRYAAAAVMHIAPQLLAGPGSEDEQMRCRFAADIADAMLLEYRMRTCPARLDPADPSCPYAGGACPVHR